MAPIDLISCLVAAEWTRRGDRLLERRRKQAAFRDPQKTLDHFDFNFNPKMNRSLVFDLATCAFIGRREDALNCRFVPLPLLYQRQSEVALCLTISRVQLQSGVVMLDGLGQPVLLH